jgi:hypothetical protein
MFRHAADSYRRVGGEMQKELLDERHLKQTIDSTRRVQSEWFRRFRSPQSTPINIEGLTKEGLWQAIGVLEEDPLRGGYFAYQREKIRHQGDIMTWKIRARSRWESIFGLSDRVFRTELDIAEEILCELICENVTKS